MTPRPILGIAVLAALTTTTLAAEPAEFTALVARVERAAVTGDSDALAAFGVELDRIPGVEDGLRRYTAAYIDWRYGTLVKSKDGQARLKQAEAVLSELVEDEPDNAEALALLGSVYGARITGALKGMRLGPKAGKALDRAEELAPDNPRVLLLQGINKFRAPKSFGGGADQAQQWLRRAAERFDREPADGSWPSWGRVDVYVWFGQVLADLGETDAARAAYYQALELEPDHAWVRNELLPALDDAED